MVEGSVLRSCSCCDCGRGTGREAATVFLFSSRASSSSLLNSALFATCVFKSV